MAVSGLEQRKVPLVVVASVWSPWGPGLVAPLLESEPDENNDNGELKIGLKSLQPKRQRSHSWGNYSTYSQLASRGFDVDSDSHSDPETPPTAVSEGRRRKRQRSRKLPLRPVPAPQLQPAPVTRTAKADEVNSKPVLLGSRQMDKEPKKGSKEADSVPQPKQCSEIAAKQCEIENTETAGITTLAIRNLPFHLRQQDLLQALDGSGFAGLYDFVYLPHKFKEHRNLGFAFVNFISEEVAREFSAAWQHSYHFASKTMRKPLNICAAAVQGRQANEKSVVSNKMDRVKNSAFRPIMINGTAVLGKIF